MAQTGWSELANISRDYGQGTTRLEENRVSLISQINSNDIFNRFSSYTRLTRTIVYCLQMLPLNRNRGAFSVEETIKVEQRILRLIQKTQFSDEITRISNSERVKGTKLATLNPMIDGSGLLRVDGRLQNANIPISQKHPILLPSRHHVTDLIIREIHERNFHAGIQSTLYAICHRFWLVDGKNQIRKVVRYCVRCIRFRASPVKYKMANLPKSSFEEVTAFHNIGVDFFGPMFIKEKKQRNRGRIKIYDCVFICMSTRPYTLKSSASCQRKHFLQHWGDSWDIEPFQRTSIRITARIS